MLQSPLKLVFLPLHTHATLLGIPQQYCAGHLLLNSSEHRLTNVLETLLQLLQIIRCTFTRRLPLHHILKVPYFYCNLMVKEVI